MPSPGVHLTLAQLAAILALHDAPLRLIPLIPD